jgi:quercetin dioxygenase-like cupin family protein
MTMSKMKLKLISAGVFAGCALGFVAMKVAWATPAQGLSSTFLNGGEGVALGDVDVKSESDVNEVEIRIKGDSDVYVVRNVVAPGGHTGWHSHPGPSIVSVVSGQATNYHADDPVGTVHDAGTAFVDDGEGAHIVRNEGNTVLELIAFQILPAGAPRRIDEPQP